MTSDPTDRSADQPNDGPEGTQGSLTSNQAKNDKQL